MLLTIIYDFRLQLLELLIENIVHFRFDIRACYASPSVYIVERSFAMKILCTFGVEQWSGTCSHGRAV